MSQEFKVRIKQLSNYGLQLKWFTASGEHLDIADFQVKMTGKENTSDVTPVFQWLSDGGDPKISLATEVNRDGDTVTVVTIAVPGADTDFDVGRGHYDVKVLKPIADPDYSYPLLDGPYEIRPDIGG